MRLKSVRFITTVPYRPTVRMRLQRFQNVWRARGFVQAVTSLRPMPRVSCDNEDCQTCCGHDYDSGEGGMCINCNRFRYEAPRPCPEGFEA